MRTFRRFEAGKDDIPAAIGWCLSDLDAARAKREHLHGPSPQALSVLREAAVVESAISSNRIEGVTVDPARVQLVLSGDSPLRDTNEEEVRGHRDALELVHEGYASLPVSNNTIQELHRRARGGIGVMPANSSRPTTTSSSMARTAPFELDSDLSRPPKLGAPWTSS